MRTYPDLNSVGLIAGSQVFVDRDEPNMHYLLFRIVYRLVRLNEDVPRTLGHLERSFLGVPIQRDRQVDVSSEVPMDVDFDDSELNKRGIGGIFNDSILEKLWGFVREIPACVCLPSAN